MTTENLEKAFGEAVRARAQLLVDAVRLVPGMRFDELSDRAVHEAVLRAVYGPGFDLAQSDSYLASAFQHTAERARAGAPAPKPERRTVARADARSYIPPWQRPLAVSTAPLAVSTAQRHSDSRNLPRWQHPTRFSKSRLRDLPDDVA